jgi:hypothetical protein
VIEWLTLLLHIREIPGSNLSPDTGYPEVFEVFFFPWRQMPSKVVVEWLRLLLRIRRVPLSKLGPGDWLS